MDKLHYYKKSIPTEHYDFYDHSKGVIGFKEPQQLDNYITFGTEDELEKALAETRSRKGKRRISVFN